MNSATVTGIIGGVFTFTAPAPTGGETIDPGTGEITGGIGGTTYTVTYLTNGTCPISTTESVTIISAPTAYADPSDAVCVGLPGFTYTVSGASASNNTGVAWSSSGLGTWTNGSTLAATYTPTAADITAGIVTLTLTVTGNAPCTIVTSTLVLTINALPVPLIYHN